MKKKHPLFAALIGDRGFYASLMVILVPSVIQLTVTNVVNLIDNIMVGTLGTAQMSGVAIANQLIFVFNLTLFGLLAGPGIYGAQYFGAGDMKGVQNVFRAKIWLSMIMTTLSLLLFAFQDGPLISLYLKGGGDPILAESIFYYTREYLSVMLWGFIPFAISQCYGSTMREAGNMHTPMRASIVAVIVNLVGNWILIFGHLGFPALGVKGAAIATVISRVAEMGVLIAAAHRDEKMRFFHGVYQTILIPRSMVKAVTIKGFPLMMNELLWSAGIAVLSQIFTLRGLHVLAANNISSAVVNLFNVVLIGTGNSVAVILGQMLGAGETERVKRDVWKLMAFSFFACALLSIIMAALSFYFPYLYNTEDDIRRLATSFICSAAIAMPFNAIANCSYFTLRSGGKTLVTFLFDASFNWVILIPCTLFMVLKTDIPIAQLYLISNLINLIKSATGILLVRQGGWVRNLVAHKPNEA